MNIYQGEYHALNHVDESRSVAIKKILQRDFVAGNLVFDGIVDTCLS